MGVGLQRTRCLIVKELIELSRDPRLLSVVILAPLLQLFLLGYAATTDVRDVPLLVHDLDRSSASRGLVERFDRSTVFTVVGGAARDEEISLALERGRAWLALTIPAGFGKQMASGGAPVVQIVADGTDAN